MNFEIAPEQEHIPGLEIPREFYRVTASPTPLAGMRLPTNDDPWEQFHAEGFRWIVCLCDESPDYAPAPLEPLVNVGLCNLVDGPMPADPESEEAEIKRIADTILEKLQLGEGVIVHCKGGRGRTGTVIGCVLKRLGIESDRIIDQLDAINQARNKGGWPESPWQAEVLERG